MPDAPRSRPGSSTRAAWLICLVLCACQDPLQEPDAASALLPPRPGSPVVVVSFDALRPDALGVYGRALDISPRIDAFAREALVFENAYSVAPKTPTSFAAFFTGRHPARVFVDWRLAPVPTLAGLFADAGYRTAAFANNPQLARARGFDRGFAHYRSYTGDDDARVVRDALAWLERHSDDPIFLWVHLIDPHAPWVARPGASHLYRDDYRGRFEQRAAQLLAVEDAAELARVRSLYDGEIHTVDRLFGRLIDGLRRLGLYDEAIVVVTSDHGEEFMEHGHVQHGWLTEENVRIPLLVRHPDAPRGQRITLRVSNLDLMPMLGHAVGIPLPAGLDGGVPGQAGANAEPLTFVANTDPRILAASILDGDTKLIVHCGRRSDRELYDLAVDPGERHDLSRQRPARVEALEQALLRRLGVARCEDLALGSPGGEAERRDLRREELDALEALGYLEGLEGHGGLEPGEPREAPGNAP
jgi:arylsulfatase A-like enzyme